MGALTANLEIINETPPLIRKAARVPQTNPTKG